LPLVEPRLSRVIRKVYPESEIQELLEAAEALEELRSTRGWQVLLNVLDAESSREMAALESTPDQVLEQAVYAKKLGYRMGLESPRAVVTTFIQIAADARVRAEAAAGAAGR